jgi:hypothetical protein
MTILSTRETEALLLLGCYRYLSREQISEFIFAKDKLASKSVNTTSWRVLGSLKRRGLVDQTARLVGGTGGGSERYGYFLTPSGYRLAASLNPALPARRPAARGTFLMRHGMMTADIALSFRRSAQSDPGSELVDWECDWQAAQRLDGSPVVPDAHFVYATEDYEVDVFLEVDVGTEGTRFFARKVARYVELYRSGRWREQLAVWPLILTVTPDERRTLALKRATEAVLSREAESVRRGMEFAFGSLTDLLGPAGPTGDIWQVAGRAGRRQLITEAHSSGQALD